MFMLLILCFVLQTPPSHSQYHLSLPGTRLQLSTYLFCICSKTVPLEVLYQWCLEDLYVLWISSAKHLEQSNFNPIGAYCWFPVQSASRNAIVWTQSVTGQLSGAATIQIVLNNQILLYWPLTWIIPFDGMKSVLQQLDKISQLSWFVFLELFWPYRAKTLPLTIEYDSVVQTCLQTGIGFAKSYILVILHTPKNVNNQISRYTKREQLLCEQRIIFWQIISNINWPNLLTVI